MLDTVSASFIAAMIALAPAWILGRTIVFAISSRKTFRPVECQILQHSQPKNEDGQPIQLRLRYSYTVNNQMFTGRRYYFGSLNECHSELLHRYPEGSRQTAYYDPSNPSRSTLQVGFHSRLWFWIICEAVVTPVMWLLIFLSLVATW